MNKKKLIKQNKDQPQRVERRFLFFLATLTRSMPVRGAGLASVRWPFSGTIAGHFQAPLLAVFRRHCWPFSGAIAGRFQAPPFSGALAGAPSRRLRAGCRRHCWSFSGAIAGHFQAPLLTPLKAPFSGAIFWLQAPFPRRLQRRFRRASYTRLEASTKEKYWITALVSWLSLSLIWIWNRNSLLRCPCILCYLNNNFMK